MSKSTKKSKVDYGDNWAQIAVQVKKRDDYRCQKCGRQFPHNSTYLHVHHVVPLSKGGTSNPDNLTTLCLDCHRDEHPHMQTKYKNTLNKHQRKYRPLVK